MYIIPFHPNKTATYTMIIHCYTDTHKPTNMPTLNYIACTDTVSYSVAHPCYFINMLHPIVRMPPRILPAVPTRHS